jgi:hypothetical protein
MEPDSERGRFPVGVYRPARDDKTGLTQGVGDLKVQLSLISGLGSHRARECDRPRVVCDQGPVQPSH